MTNDKYIIRYNVNEHGELPLSYGRYVRYEDYEDHVNELLGVINSLESDYTNGYEDGWGEGYEAGLEDGR
jgi:hypothetical protein